MSTDIEFTWGMEFANPWHDEEGKFAPKGTGKQSTGAPAPEPAAPAAEPPVGQTGRTSGADTTALAAEVVDGMRFDEETQTWISEKSITIKAVDADDVIKQFADAPIDVVDLTAVTLEGSPNMFSQMREAGIPRDQMPQITPDVQAEWWSTLAQRKIAFQQQDVDPAALSATQSELNGKKVGGMIRSLESGAMSLEGDPLMVSNDGHVLDGHHRWAATAAMSADCGGCIKIPVVVIDLPMVELLPLANQWVDEKGIARAGVGDPSKIVKKQAAGMSPLFFTMKGVSEFATKLTVTNPMSPEDIPKCATDIEDGITPEDTAGLPRGDGSAFAKPAAEAPTEASNLTAQWKVEFIPTPDAVGEFMNPWHDEIGRFAPKGTGRAFSGGEAVPTIERDADGNIIVSDEAKALAKPIFQEAQRRERDITNRLSQLIGDEDPAYYDPDAPPPPQLYGYKYVQKAEKDIAEKIERVVEEKQLTREQAARDIKDALRYTVHFTQDEFGPRSQDIINQLAEENPKGNVKNTWPPSKDNPYKGVNVNVTTEDGFTYEIQFHTPESQAVKDQQHEIYKEVRALPADHPRRVEADAKMMELAQTLQEDPPTGAIEVALPERWRKRRSLTASASTPQWRLL